MVSSHGKARTLVITVVALLAALVASVPPAGASADASYDIVELGTLGGDATYALDLNERGQVTGNSRTSTATSSLVGFAWHDGQMTEIGALPGSNGFSRGYAVNNRGVVVGESDNDRPRAFRWYDGELSDLGDLGGGTAVAHGINDAELVVGASSNGQASRPFLWTRGQMRDLGTVVGGTNTPGRAWDINARGDVVGASRAVGTTSQATLWAGPNRRHLGSPVSLGSLGDGQRFSEAFAVNDRRQVVGRSSTVNTGERAFLWTAGEGMQDLGSLGLNHSRALDINERGQVVGFASSFAGHPGFGAAAAFLWEDGEMVDLGDLVDPDSGWELLAAQAINNQGTITGYGRFDGRIRSFLLVPAS